MTLSEHLRIAAGTDTNAALELYAQEMAAKYPSTQTVGPKECLVRFNWNIERVEGKHTVSSMYWFLVIRFFTAFTLLFFRPLLVLLYRSVPTELSFSTYHVLTEREVARRKWIAQCRAVLVTLSLFVFVMSSIFAFIFLLLVINALVNVDNGMTIQMYLLGLLIIGGLTLFFASIAYGAYKYHSYVRTFGGFPPKTGSDFKHVLVSLESIQPMA